MSTDRSARLLLGAVALFTLLVGLSSLAWPFSWDAGIFTWVAGAIRSGALPYVDAWDAKGPFAYYAYALVQGGGPQMWPARLLDLGVMTVGAGAVGLLVAGRHDGTTAGRHEGTTAGRQDGRWAGAWTALLVILTYYSTDFWNTAQPDAWIAAMSSLAMLLLLRQDIARRPLLLACASMLLGLGILQKPTFAAWLVLPGLAVLLRGEDANHPVSDGMAAGRRLLVAVLATGATLVPAVLTGWWFWRQGAWPALVEGYLTVNLEISRSVVGGVVRAIPWSLHRLISTTPLVLAVPGVAVGAAWLWRRDRRVTLLLLAWMLSAWLMVVVQRRYFAYHWVPLLFAMAPLAGMGLGVAAGDRDGTQGAASRIMAWSLVGALLVVLVMPLQVRVRDALGFATGRMDLPSYLAQFPPMEAELVAADIRLAEYLGSHSRAADRVVVWDSPLANALSGRRPPSRIGFFFPLVTPRAGGGSHPPGPAQQRLRSEYLAGLDDPGTRVVAMTDGALRGVEPQPRKSIPMLFPELLQHLQAGWTLTDSVGPYRIFTRRAP